MGIDKGKAELQVVGTDDLRNIVAQTDRGIRIYGAFGNVARVFGEIILPIYKAYAGYLGGVKTKAIVIEAQVAKSAGALPGAAQGRRNVIGGVTGDELVEQRGRNAGCDSRHHTDTGILETRLNSREGDTVGPQRDWILLLPRVVNVVEAGANFVVDVVVDLKQFLAPVRGKRRSQVP